MQTPFRRRLLSLGLALLSGGIVMLGELASRAQSTELLANEARVQAMALGGTLMQQLTGALAAGDVGAAIGACSQIAPAASEQVVEPGWTVGRTSLRWRNPDNAPDEWEEAVLVSLALRNRLGEPPTGLEHAEIVDTDEGPLFRFMKAIPTQPLCLQCHGTSIEPPVREALDALYPEDRATGFALGELRGAFTIERRL